MKFGGKCKYCLLNLKVYGSWRRLATYQHIMVKREDPNLLTITTQKITGLCHQDFGC